MQLKLLRFATLAAAVSLAGASVQAANTPPTATADRQVTHDTYSDDEVAKAASDFFSSGAKGLSEVLAKVLKDKGHPVAIIRGEEAGGAIGVGLRYGQCESCLRESGQPGAPCRAPGLEHDSSAADRISRLGPGRPGCLRLESAASRPF